MADTEVLIPNAWEPRKHQLRFWRYMQGGGLRAVAVWHRRAGKDSTALNLTASLAHQRIGTYWHMLPEKEQARKAVWNGIDKMGRRIIDQVFPLELRAKTIDDEMRIDLKCGSIWQLVGSDNFNSLVGANPIGVVFSEYSVGNPAAWDYIRPILAENGGWAIFLYTARGKNHGYHLFEMARKNPEWYAELLTVDDTLILPPSVIQAERDSGMDDDMIQQEYFCSFEGVRQGSIYGTILAKLRREGRIGSFPYDRRYPVNTFWDIGHSDTTALWFHQEIGGNQRFIKSYEAAGEDLAHYVAVMRDTGYLFGKHYLPHDAKNVTVASKSNPLGKNVWDQAYALGLRDLVLVPRTPDVWTAINATRSRMTTVQIDEAGCEDGLNALGSYHKKWNDDRKTYESHPHHDWSSNYADAFRQWAQGYHGQAGTSTFTAPAAMPQASPRFTPPIHTIGVKRVGY